MPISLISIQYCYDYLINQISLNLLMYAHIPTAIIAILFGIFLIYNSRSISSISLFIVCMCFATWSFLDIGSWFAYLGAEKMMFFWSLLDVFVLVFFFFSYYFLYTFIKEKDLPFWQKMIGLGLLLPTAIWTFFGLTLTKYDASICEAWESDFMSLYPYFVEGIFLLASIFFVASQYFKEKNRSNRIKILLTGLGVISFLGFFLSATLAVNLLVDYGAVEFAYNYEIYGLFGMPLLLGLLTFIVVRYHAFNIKLIGAQALIISLIILIGSQFLFIEGNVTKILTSITLLITGAIGINLMRSVKREVEQREKIEKQEKILEATNSKLASANTRLQELDKQKSEFLSFASHQLRSPLTAIKGYASLILDGDYGQVPPELKHPIQVIFDSTNTLVTVVSDYLNVSRIELGQMKYDFTLEDMKKITEHIIEELQPNVNKAGLKLSMTNDPGDYTTKVDKDKIIQVVTNIIDNSVKYTKKGSVTVEMKKKPSSILLAIKDTGIGISKETLPKLFAKFVRAGNANQTNSRGTGLGLYIAKDIVEKHKGKIWAESQGEGMGSQFYIEIPVVKA